MRVIWAPESEGEGLDETLREGHALAGSLVDAGEDEDAVHEAVGAVLLREHLVPAVDEVPALEEDGRVAGRVHAGGVQHRVDRAALALGGHGPGGRLALAGDVAGPGRNRRTGVRQRLQLLMRALPLVAGEPVRDVLPENRRDLLHAHRVDVVARRVAHQDFV